MQRLEIGEVVVAAVGHGHDVIDFPPTARLSRSRRDPAEAMTLNQVAAMALGVGPAQNGALVGRTVDLSGFLECRGYMAACRATGLDVLEP